MATIMITDSLIRRGRCRGRGHSHGRGHGRACGRGRGFNCLKQSSSGPGMLRGRLICRVRWPFVGAVERLQRLLDRFSISASSRAEDVGSES